MSPFLRLLLGTMLVTLACALPAGVFAADHPLAQYSNYARLKERVEKLAESDVVEVRSLGKTAEDRDVFLLTLSTGDADKKPAMLIVGDVVPQEVVGSEVVLAMVEKLVERAAKEDAIKELLARRTLYIIPRPSPDAAEKCFAHPVREPQGNARATDDDHDHVLGEDPPEDLNGDGFITMMRVEDVAGGYIPHPDDERVMILAEVTKQERGKYRLLVEGRDNDGDEDWNEDAGDGVAFNRNFTFQYPAYEEHAGPHQVSEPETRAVADFCFDHPNIGSVWTMTPEDNLLRPWKADSGKDNNRIRTTILSRDATYQDVLAAKYKELRGDSGVPDSPEGKGSFSRWAYFHYGRGSLATRPWWIPPVEAKKEEGDEGKEKEKEKKSDDKRAADERNALRWMDEQKIDGFVPWTPIEHPDFPNQKVEVGGFKPFYRTHPPIAEVAGIADIMLKFLLTAEPLSPRLALYDVKAEALGGGVVRLSARIANEGFLPTMLEMGEVNQQMYPLQAAWEVPEKTEWLQGSRRTRLPRLSGEGGVVEWMWLVRLPEPLPESLKLKVWAPAVGEVEATVSLGK